MCIVHFVMDYMVAVTFINIHWHPAVSVAASVRSTTASQFVLLFYHSDSSSSSSDDSPARSVQSAAVPAPSALPLSSLDKDEPRKSFGIKVQNLPVRSTG